MTEGRPDIFLTIGGVACLAALAAALVLAVVGTRLFRRFGRLDPDALPKALGRLGYERRNERWVRSADGVPVWFDEVGVGWRWTARLPRYQAVALRIEERGSEWPPVAREGAFLAGDPELDERFRFRSERPAPSLALLATEGVGEALLALPFVDLDVNGDEVVLRDPTRAGLAARLGAVGADPRTPAAVAAQARLHRQVGTLMIALARYRG